MSDLISRQDAIALVDKPITPTGDAVYDNAREDERASIKDGLSLLPSAEPRKHIINDGTEVVIDEESYGIGYTHGQMAEPKTGKWIFNPKDAIELMFTLPKCSECGFESSDGGNFCSNCGARMEWKDGE